MENVLRTPVDDLVDYVKSQKKCNIKSIKLKLKLPSEIIERWLVILEEFGVIKLNYKGFDGFAEFIESSSKKTEELNVLKLKEIFIEKSKNNHYSASKIQSLWVIFIKEYETEIKQLFFQKAKKRGYQDEKLSHAWNMFREELNSL